MALNWWRIGLDIREKFFIVSMEGRRNKFPTKAVNAPFLEVFKGVLDRALSNLV